MRRLVVPLVLLTLFPSSLPSGQRREKILVVLSPAPAPRAARALPIGLRLRRESYWLAEVAEEALPQVAALGAAVRMVGRDDPERPLYLITRREGGALLPLPGGEILHSAEGEVLARLTGLEAQALGEAGYEMALVPAAPLPAAAWEERAMVSLPPPAPGVEIQDLVDQVSEDSLRAYLQRLQDFQTRFAHTDSGRVAGLWLRQKFLSFGYTDVALDSFVLNWGGEITTQWNVVATKPGAVAPETVIIVGGHYDSIIWGDNRCERHTWAPGVDDNGSGTAATMEMARILASVALPVTVKFVPFAAEEEGLWGSEHYAAKAQSEGMNIRLMMNFDMISNSTDGDPDVYINTSTTYRAYAERMADMAEQYTGLRPIISTGDCACSDHWPFQARGYPFVYGEEGDFSPNWHLCTDTIDNVNVPYHAEVTRMAIATLASVAGGGLPAVFASMTPESVSVAPGGGFVLTGRVTNTTNQPQTIEAALQATLPNGHPYPGNPVRGPVTVTLQPYQEVRRPVVLGVPSSAPPGRYLLRLVVDTSPPTTPLDEDTVVVRITGPAEAVGSWGLEGWSFSGEWFAGEPASSPETARQTALLGVPYPNPGPGSFTIPLSLKGTGEARVAVYTLRGERVRTLWEGRLPGGPFEVKWDGRDAAGRPLAIGQYLVRLEGSAGTQTRRLTLSPGWNRTATK